MRMLAKSSCIHCFLENEKASYSGEFKWMHEVIVQDNQSLAVMQGCKTSRKLELKTKWRLDYFFVVTLNLSRWNVDENASHWPIHCKEECETSYVQRITWTCLIYQKRGGTLTRITRLILMLFEHIVYFHVASCVGIYIFSECQVHNCELPCGNHNITSNPTLGLAGYIFMDVLHRGLAGTRKWLFQRLGSNNSEASNT